MTVLTLCSLAFLAALPVENGKVVTTSAVSPDGRNEISLWTEPLSYAVSRDGVTVVSRTPIGMKIDGEWLRSDSIPKIDKVTKNGCVWTPVYKKSFVDLSANETFADFGTWGVRLSARDDGVAYRFETGMQGEITVDGETAGLTIPDSDGRCALCYGNRFGCEETVPLSCRAGEIETGKANDRSFVYLPFVYEIGGKHVAVTESDVFDYPILNLKRKADAPGVMLSSTFAGWPVSTARAADDADWNMVDVPSGGRWLRVKEQADYLVKTEGVRTFPWRTFVLADTPSTFCESDVVFALARPQVADDFSWVKPGKVAWDWWNAWDNKGEDSGCTTAMYKRFVDFAARAGVEYVILDEGWSERLDIWKFHPNVDVPEIIRYGNEKGVGIILWMAWAQIYGCEAKVARHFSELGARGFKVDFMDRGDADCERFLWKFADACAKNRMLLDYHGAHRPTGMSRAYPNVLNFEGVHGLEMMKFYKGEDFADIDVKHFFLRMTAGPMDYTPGAMDNYPFGNYGGDRTNPGSLGTRARQMALMVAYEAPLQMLCDAPSKYEKNAECFDFMAKTPVVWTKTVGLGGSPDTFAAVARRAYDGSWYVAGIANGRGCDFVLDTSFLTDDDWTVESFCDAVDAATRPTHYVHESGRTISAGARISFQMAPGGGFVVKFSKHRGSATLDVQLVRDIPYVERSADSYRNERCKVDLKLPGKNGFKTLVWFHGGGLEHGEKEFIPISSDIAQVAVNYRLMKEDNGVRGEDCIRDAAASVAWTIRHIAEYGGDPRKVYVSGLSAGGYLTMMVGMAPKYLAEHGYKPTDLAGIVPVSGQATTHFNVRRHAGDKDPQYLPKVDELAPLRWVSADLPPILSVCGEPPWEWKCRSEENRLLIASCVALGHKDASFVCAPYCDHGRAYTAGVPYVEMFVQGRMPKNLQMPKLGE